MISLLFIILAAICNAIMDTVDHHFENSIFKKLNPKFFNKQVSWKYVKFLPFTKYRPDFWHINKSLVIVFICLSIVFYSVIYNWYLDVIVLGSCWNLSFNIFYNKVFNYGNKTH